MGASKLLTLLLISSVVYGYPHFPGHPRFYDEGRESSQPTVNVFKIYAPRLFYMPGYKPQLGRSENNFIEKSKQMITEPTERILDGIIRAEMFPESLFENDMEMMQYDDDYVPEPSNIVSRKLPIYAPFRGPPMVTDVEPSMNIDEYPPLMRNNRRDFMDDAPQFFPDYFDMHGENCNHHHHFQSANDNPLSGPYPDFAAIQVFDPLFLNDIPPQTSMGNLPNSGFSPVPQAMFQSNRVGPLGSFFNKFVSDPMNRNNQVEAQLLTTVTYGAPEMVKSNEVAAAAADADSSDSNGEIEVIITEKLEPIAAGEEQEKEEESPIEEIERNFIKTILPDNTFVTTEVNSEKKVTEKDEETSESKDADVPMEEVEVNIVKTILPDDSYLVSEAGGEDEKFQDEVISMIQNSDVTATEGSKGSVFISRYIETPPAP